MTDMRAINTTEMGATRLPIKSEMISGLVRYRDNQIPTGGFLHCILSNDLKMAVQSADHDNMWAIPAIVAWCYHNLPSSAWGSPERVKAWLTKEEPK